MSISKPRLRYREGDTATVDLLLSEVESGVEHRRSGAFWLLKHAADDAYIYSEENVV